MNLFDYVSVLLRRGWIIALAVLVAAGGAFILSRTQTVEYKASQKVLIEPSRNDFGLVETSRILLRSYVEYLNTDLRAQEVIERLELDMTPGQLRQQATINSDPTTLTLQIDIELEDATSAAEIANTWGQLFVAYRDRSNSDLERADRIEANLLDYPQPAQSKPNTRTNVVAAAVLGLLIGGLVVFGLEYFEASLLRSPKDIERWLDTPILALIPSESKGD